jgi:hypothetical protein
MFHRIRDYELIATAGRLYRPRMYGEPDAGAWRGWLVFFPVDGGVPIAPPGPETTQLSLAVLSDWAADLTPVYLHGSLDRALATKAESHVVDHLIDLEEEALEDADRLEAKARIERTAARVDEIAAADARAEAEEIRRDRLATQPVDAPRTRPRGKKK